MGLGGDVEKIQHERALSAGALGPLLDYQHKIHAILSNSEIRDPVSEILEVTCKYLGWPVGEMWQVAEGDSRLCCVAAWHDGSRAMEEFIAKSKQRPMAKGEGLPGRIWDQGRPQWIVDVTEDSNFPRKAKAAECGLRVGLGFPVIIKDEALGVMNFFGPEALEPDAETLVLMEVVGRQIGLLLKERIEREARKDAEARYQITADAAADAIFTIDEGSRIVFANQAVFNIFGYRPAEITGQNISIIVPERLREAHARGMKRYIETGKRGIPWRGVELPGLHKDGYEIEVEISFGEFSIGGRHLFTGVARDITQRKQFQKTQSFLLEASTALSSSLDYKTTLDRVSRLAVPFFSDWCAVDLLNDGVLERVSVAHSDLEKAALAKSLSSEYPTDLNANIGVARVIKTGESELVSPIDEQVLQAVATDERHRRLLQDLDLRSYIIVPLQVRNETLGAIIFVRGSTTMPFTEVDLRAAEELAGRSSMAIDNAKLFEKAREHAERFGLAIEATQLGIWYRYNNKDETYWSSRCREILGFDEDDSIEDSLFYKVIHPKDRERVAAVVSAAMSPEGEGILDIEYRVIGPKGDLKRWARSRGRRYLDVEGKTSHIIGTVLDITKQKASEAKIKKFNKELEKNVRERTKQLEAANKELETFSYSVSHDLRAPLRGIEGFADLLMRNYSKVLDEEGQKYLQRVCSGSKRMSQLIDDLLNLSRITRRDMCIREFSLSKLACEVAEELQEREPTRKVDLQIQEDIWVRADENLMRTVLENLIGNSWKFTQKKKEARIELGCLENQGEKVYFVRDNGAGFNMEYAHKLFGAFQRLHQAEDFSGTGIGLASAQRVIHRHGGRIWAEGALEKGASFYFTLDEL